MDVSVAVWTVTSDIFNLGEFQPSLRVPARVFRFILRGTYPKTVKM